jgi:hypothetical protein
MATEARLIVEVPMTDDAVRNGIETLLERRRHALEGNPSGQYELAHSRLLAITILTELLRPFARELGIQELFDSSRNSSAERKRELAAICFKGGLPLSTNRAGTL